MLSSDTDYNEKRNFIRMFVNAEVNITDPATGKTFSGKGENLSGDGAMFVTSEKFTINQKLNVDISSEQSKTASLTAVFEVIRVDKTEDGQYRVAGTMLDVK